MRSAGELESVKNFYSLSAPTSMSSVHHQLDDWPSWSDWIGDVTDHVTPAGGDVTAAVLERLDGTAGHAQEADADRG